MSNIGGVPQKFDANLTECLANGAGRNQKVVSEKEARSMVRQFPVDSMTVPQAREVVPMVRVAVDHARTTAAQSVLNAYLGTLAEKVSESHPLDQVNVDLRPGEKLGVVKWFKPERGYGFIAPRRGEDVMVYSSQIQTEGHDSLREGQVVAFQQRGSAARPTAHEVRIV
jgi:CspA family cold shock protein